MELRNDGAIQINDWAFHQKSVKKIPDNLQETFAFINVYINSGNAAIYKPNNKSLYQLIVQLVALNN